MDQKNELKQTGELVDLEFTQRREMIDDRLVQFTVLRVPRMPGVDILTDPRFAELGIATEPDSLLINQPSTTLKFRGRPAGETPEDYIKDLDNVLAVGGNHFGWQKGALLVKSGEIIQLPNDETLNGSFSILSMGDTGVWSVKELQFGEGRDKLLDDIRLGMSGAQIVKDGSVVPTSQLASDPRIRADLRNLVDFSDGHRVSGDFFQDIRGFSPEASQNKINPAAVRRLAMGRMAVFKAAIPQDSESQAPYERLRSAVGATDGALIIDKKNGDYRLGVMKPLPEQHMPLTGFGHDSAGQLVIVLADGRQAESAGVSIRELANLMVGAGVVNGILGVGGGDVAAVEKRNGVTTLLNSPSQTDKAGNRVTRRTPNVVVVPLQ